jgi:two-component system phosphate regulon sensor histidine kinase PhoR
MTGTERPHDICNFESVLLAIAGHDLRQSLHIVQTAHDLLGHGLRTGSELRHLRSSQKALNRLNEQLSQLLMALRMRLHATKFELSPVCIEQLLKQACQENDNAAQRTVYGWSQVKR